MQTNTVLSETIGQVISEISHRREEIKQDYIKAWLAHTVPDAYLKVDWLIENVRLVEEWSKDRTTVSWHLEMKSKT